MAFYRELQEEKLAFLSNKTLAMAQGIASFVPFTPQGENHKHERGQT